MRSPTVLLLAVLVTISSPLTNAADEAAALKRGEYLFRAGACESCHTDVEHGGAFLAGGRAMRTAFGTFYTPNITPSLESGIGRWALEDFRRAMIEGSRPDGRPYYPVFPYRWYTGMRSEDIADLWAYLQAIPPVENAVPPHKLNFPFNIRWLVLIWKLFNFDQGETVFDSQRSAQWNRGAYLVNHLGHCGACHTPKVMSNFIGIEFLAGSTQIPGGLPAPNITPDVETGIGTWSPQDIVRALKRAMRPDGTPIRGPMAEYVLYGSSYLSDADLDAIAVYLMSLPAEEWGIEFGTELSQQVLEHDDHGSAGVRSLMAVEGKRTLAK